MADLIDRQAVLNILERSAWRTPEELDAFLLVKKLPSVTPQKVGRWRRKIVDVGYNADWICSECGYKEMTDLPTKYCPNCGAKMKESEDKE